MEFMEETPEVLGEGRSAAPEWETLHSSAAFAAAPISIQWDKLDQKWESLLQMEVSP